MATPATDGMTFLRAFNDRSLKYLSGRILVIGGGDTAMDVVAASKRLGNVADVDEANLPENVLAGKVAHDDVANKEDADCWLVYRRPIEKAPCTKHELEASIAEGVEIHDSLAPVEAVLDDQGRARALKVQPVDWSSGEMVESGEPFEIECTMIVGATGQTGDFTGIEEGIANEWNQIDAEKNMQVKGKPGHFAGGDTVNPDLLTTAIGHASIAVEGIDQYLRGENVDERPKVDGHHFDLLEELEQKGLSPEEYNHEPTWGTSSGKFAVHNFEDRADADVIKTPGLFLAHFEQEQINQRENVDINASNVLGSMLERFSALSEEETVNEAKRCMSCGLCFECDNCIIYCPQDAVFRVKKGERAMGRYVDTDYAKCVGCHICKEVCPTGYIDMGLGQY
jgi:Pyruvate/2-oxoacid:ferredoxin oxidoreductase delta subunit